MVFPLFMAILFGAALPLFFFLMYRSAPLLLVPETVRRAALAAAIVTGLAGALTTYSFIRSLPVVWANAQTVAQQMDHPFVWFWQAIVTPAIDVIPAVVVPLFFVSLYRLPSGTQPVSRMVKKAAVFAAATCLLGTIMSGMGIYTTAKMSQYALMSRMNLSFASSLLYGLSLAIFFVAWCRWVPSDQSS
jgi:hypothetical protein